MKSFSSFKQYVFTHLFPYYYKDNDTYKDSEGKGILERFIEVCSEYLDKEVIPDIDNFMDILDVDKTPDIFLNYLWEYFGYIPYAYGVLTRGEPYTPENVARWLNNPAGFPKADTRAVLRYAISLYKIRGTEAFYTVLGRFYGVRFELIPNGTLDEEGGENSGEDVIVASYQNIVSLYTETEGKQIKAGYRFSDCWSCNKMKLNVYIPQGMYDLLQQQGEDRLKEVQEAFEKIIEKYLPIHVVLDKSEGGIQLIPDMPTLYISSPPILPTNKSKATIRVPYYTSPEMVDKVPEPDPTAKLVVGIYNDKGVLYDDVKAGYMPPEN